jgi:phosphatidylcholine synthase
MASARLFLIHVLTASGSAFALLALFAAGERRWPAMFGWLGVALVVDAIDGPLARRFKVETGLPRWSGVTLDLVVDFVTYVFVPAYAIAQSDLIPGLFAPAAGMVVVVTGALYFADRDMKTPDNYFRGFPALWNVVAFYLLLLRPGPVGASVAVAGLAVASFLPFPFIHPLRVKRLRLLNVAVLAAWTALALVALRRDMSPGPWVTGALCVMALYVFGAGVLRRS